MCCEICGAPGSERIVSGDSMILCQKCQDKLTIHEAFHNQIPAVTQFERSDPKRSMAILDDLQTKYQSLDHDGWLYKSTRSHRALILMYSKQYEEAIQELRALTKLLIYDPDAFIENQIAIADVLERSGRYGEAMSEIEAGVPFHDRVHPNAVLGLVSAYARLARRQGSDIPSRYRSVIESAVAAWGISIPPDILSSSIVSVVEFANTEKRQADKRYTSLRERLKEQSREVQSRMLHDFIEAEPVGFYRELASRDLDTVSGEPAGTEKNE